MMSNDLVGITCKGGNNKNGGQIHWKDVESFVKGIGDLWNIRSCLLNKIITIT